MWFVEGGRACQLVAPGPTSYGLGDLGLPCRHLEKGIIKELVQGPHSTADLFGVWVNSL
jgi:hypothetical protein